MTRIFPFVASELLTRQKQLLAFLGMTLSTCLPVEFLPQAAQCHSKPSAVQTGTKHLRDPYKILLRVTIAPSFGNGMSLRAFGMCPNFSLCAGSALLLFCAGELDFHHFPCPAYLCSLLFTWPTMSFIPCPQICICEQRASLYILFFPSVSCVRPRDTFQLSSWLVLLVAQKSELKICHKLKKLRAFLCYIYVFG